MVVGGTLVLFLLIFLIQEVMARTNVARPEGLTKLNVSELNRRIDSAQAAYKQEDYLTANRLLEDILNFAPANHEALALLHQFAIVDYALTDGRLEGTRWEHLVKLSTTALQHDHQNDPAIMLLALVAAKSTSESGKASRGMALKQLRQLADEDSYPLVYVVLGSLLAQVGDNDEAIRVFEKGTQTGGMSGGGYEQLGDLYALSGGTANAANAYIEACKALLNEYFGYPNADKILTKELSRLKLKLSELGKQKSPCQ